MDKSKDSHFMRGYNAKRMNGDAVRYMSRDELIEFIGVIDSRLSEILSQTRMNNGRIIEMVQKIEGRLIHN